MRFFLLPGNMATSSNRDLHLTVYRRNQPTFPEFEKTEVKILMSPLKLMKQAKGQVVWFP